MTPRQPRVAAFDIIGTVFSLESLRARLTDAGAPAHALELWIGAGLRDLFALAAAGQHRAFREVLDGTLATLLPRHGVPARREVRDSLLDGFSSLAPQEEARRAFEHLATRGVRIMALTNSAGPVTQGLLEKADLLPLVEHVVSIDDVGLPKPRREVYLHAAQLAGVASRDLALISAHPWDINGAAEAGLVTAFVARQAPYPAFFRAPDRVGETLEEAAALLTSLPPRR